VTGDDHDRDLKLLAALGAVTRRRILRQMQGGMVASPRELSALLELELTNVAYHVRVLAAKGVITSVEKKHTAGNMIEHFYRSSEIPDWAKAIIDGEAIPGG
jgi:DNA-binding transcriptional ArsR family regulator